MFLFCLIPISNYDTYEIGNIPQIFKLSLGVARRQNPFPGYAHEIGNAVCISRVDRSLEPGFIYDGPTDHPRFGPIWGVE
ncbi:hypothetical protein SAMN05421752_11429 [Natronorubrum thiooxidans]|uniref:Uncharacterized protein n=1 Tax=Natronorubrum thiooxidans TaxID=308853 RepID=A0A1N7GPY1_9EURY|nr:hypothetical protein SAMN05421752_11429 [Natronorubrum thiooxidans]